MIRRGLITAFLTVIFGIVSYGQFADCSTGLMQAPSAEMQPDGTFMITNNFLNKNSLASSNWDYNTFQYGFYVSLWGRIELGYVCTILNDHWHKNFTPDNVYIVNQDRHFVGRVCLLKEGEFELKWMPALVIGVSDPTTGSGDAEYISVDDVSGSGNGYFNRNYVVLSKHFDTPWGVLGTHLGYQFNKRTDYPINGPCVGVDWTPVWIQYKGILDGMKLILEYDSRTVNMGFIASLWENRFEALFELQNFQWVNFGLRYKVRLKKVAVNQSL